MRMNKVEYRTEQAALIHKKYLNPVKIHSAVPDHARRAFADFDSELLEKMFKAKNGTAVTALWHADTSAYEGDDSRADSALCKHLAFWTHSDAKRIDRMFRTSALMRPKWDEKRGNRTYGEITISNAVEAQRSFVETHDFDYVSESGIGTHASVALIDPFSNEKRYSWNDTGSGALFADTYKNVARYVPQAVSWYVYKNGIWKIDEGSLRIAELAKALVRHMISCAANIKDDERRAKYLSYTAKLSSNKVRDAMLISARSIFPLQITEFDKDPFVFNFKNGTFQLKAFEFKPHDPNDFLSKTANVSYDPNACYPRWNQFIDEITGGDKEKALYLQKAIGYSLTGSTIEKKCFFLHGQTTNNGKSTMNSALLNIFGDYGTSIQANSLEKKQFSTGGSGPSADVAALAGTRFVSISEPDRSMRLDAGLLKQLTGGVDQIVARFMRQNFFSFYPSFKLFLQCNDLPQTTDDTLFSSDRAQVINFDRHFGDDEQDHTLDTEFRKPENASGILNWMLEGCRLYLCCGLNSPDSIKSATEAYRDESDLIGTFVAEVLVKKHGAFTLASAVYMKYQIWCEQNGYKKMSFKTFNRDIGRHMEAGHGKNGKIFKDRVIKISASSSSQCSYE